MWQHYYAVQRYAFTVIAAFGILGNTLVILSVLRKRSLLKSNYYYLVLQLAICDLTWLLIEFIQHIDVALIEETLFARSIPVCIVFTAKDIFSFAGIYMMLIISILRYRTSVHPLKPAISRRKLKIICALGYIIGLIVIGPFTTLCFAINEARICATIFKIVVLMPLPTIFLCVVYYKICRALVKHSKFMKTVCSNPFRRKTTSSLKILRYSKNQRTVFVCFATAFCYTAGLVPLFVFDAWFMIDKSYQPQQLYLLFIYGYSLRAAGSCSVNPLIYGILDKKLLAFWKLCTRRKRAI